MAKYNVHAGHCPQGKGASGATGLLKESVEDRLIKNEVIKLLKANGHTVYDCTCDTAETQSGCLSKIVSKCNQHSVDLDISIHLNSGKNDKKGDGKVGGFETWATANTGIKKQVSERIRKNMKAIGFTDRGSKTTSGLYVLNHTKSKAILLEVCFVDDKDDYNLYKKVGYKAVAKAIVEGILGVSSSASSTKYTTVKKTSSKTAIKWLQTKLNTCYTGKLAKLSVDGIWGPKTQAMLEAYWKQLGWKKGIYAGTKTCKALYANKRK